MANSIEDNTRKAERQHDRIADFEQTLIKATFEIGHTAFRTAVIINGGAAIAILAFLGTLVGQGKLPPANLSIVAPTLIWFALGVFAAGAAMVALHFMSYFALRQHSALRTNYEPPYLHETTGSQKFFRLSYYFQLGAVVAATASLLLFIGGMITTFHAITRLH